MAKTAMVRARIEPELKNEVESIFNQIGLNATEAITAFYKNVKLYRGIPFELRLPNKETQKAIEDVRKGKGKKFSSVALLRKELES
jgi:DNA-damage-inducible protein J